MPFVDNNVLFGLQKNNSFKVGVSDIDKARPAEDRINLPITVAADATWMYFECAVGVMLDSGIVVHNRLPQVDGVPDTLASEYLDNPIYDKLFGGVNLKSKDQYTDIVQRMGHSRYWFRLWGRALRVGKQVPIPGIKTIGGVPAIPYDRNPQWALNSIVPGGSYSGVVLWKAEWSLWYTTAVPPVNNVIPAVDAAAHVSSLTPSPVKIQAPFSQADDNAVPVGPGIR